jgi:hypothetical protein
VGDKPDVIVPPLQENTFEGLWVTDGYVVVGGRGGKGREGKGRIGWIE